MVVFLCDFFLLDNGAFGQALGRCACGTSTRPGVEEAAEGAFGCPWLSRRVPRRYVFCSKSPFPFEAVIIPEGYGFVHAIEVWYYMLRYLVDLRMVVM